MKNFTVLNKIGTFSSEYNTVSLGEGSFSTVYKVRRLSDN